MIKARSISGRSETRNLLCYFERQTNLPKRTNSKILFLLILVIRKIPWTILLTDSSCVLNCLSWCMAKLYTKLLKFDIPKFSPQPSDRFILKKNKHLLVKHYWNSDIPNNERLCEQQSRLGKQKGHYNFTPLEVCLSEMAYTTGCCSLKAQFIPLGIAFGSIRKRLE